MGEVRGAFVELEPPDNTMIGEIFCHARFRYAEMFGKLRLQGIRTTAACAAAQEISYGDAQSLTSFDIVIACEFGLDEEEDAGPHGSMVRFAKSYRRTAQQAAELHFKKRQSGGQAGIARTAAHTWPGRLANRFDERGDGASIRGFRRSGNDRFVKDPLRQTLRRACRFRSAGCGDC